jgi:hypothetical protein
MTSVRSALMALVVIFAAQGALAMGPVQSGTQFATHAQRRATAWMTVRLCNGISKATRTICCGTSPPAWCGKRVNSTDIGDVFNAGPGRGDGDVMSIVSDPMFYICMIISITIIYLAALAGSGRDNGVEGGV